MKQVYLADREQLDIWLSKNKVKHILLVCGASINCLELNRYFEGLQDRMKIRVTRFSDFMPNPKYESVEKGVKLLRQLGADAIIAVGGGSAMDVAKCIKLFCMMGDDRNYLQQKIVTNGIRLLAVPTTAGTGSEATKFAVIYYKGEKQSIAHDNAIPEAVLLDPSVLRSLPDYQRKATMLDAFCHGIESFWSVNSTDESRGFSRDAIRLIIENYQGYLKNEYAGNAAMLRAANIAGKAINIAQTTAGHAMCYKLTSLYGIAHGHAAALCVAELWSYTAEHTDRCVDPRGREYLEKVLEEAALAMGIGDVQEASHFFKKFVARLGLERPHPCVGDIGVLQKSVNLLRLQNHPVRLTDRAISELYKRILD